MRILPFVILTLGFAAAAEPRGYDVPLVDLSFEVQRQVVVDKEKGQYLGHPTTVLLEDGRTIIAVYPKGHGKGAILMKRSPDGGKTWGERLPTPKNWETSKETPTIHRVVDAKGKKRLILFSGLYPIRMAVSEDDGGTWSELKPIGRFGGIVAMGCVERLKNGDYMALFHDDGRYFKEGGKAAKPPVFTVYKTLSKDGGLTWGNPEVVATHEAAHLCEPGLVRSPDGKQIAVLLRENSRKMNSFVIFSDDEGKTWTKPRELPAALTGDRHVGKYAPDGRLFLTFRDTTLDSPTKGDWVGWLGTYEDIVKGREGQYRVRLMRNFKGADCAYPGLELLPDGTFVTTTYGHWTPGELAYVASVRFTVKELDERAKQLVYVTLKTSKGDIVVEMDPRRAPATVANFLRNVDAKLYDGGRFHRAVTKENQPDKKTKIEVIQGGPVPAWAEEGFAPIKLERTNITGWKHYDGVISMARDGPDSATADIFICIGDMTELDFGGKRNPDGQGFGAFGRVVKGMDVVKAIQQSPLAEQRLAPAITILKATRNP